MYWDFKPVYQQIKELIAANPKLSRKEDLSMVAPKKTVHRTNPVRKRFSGAQEIARRKSQIERRIICAN